MIPRIRARVGQATEPPEMAGKYFVELSLWTLDGETLIGDWNIGPWDTEEIAKKEMMRATQLVSQGIEKEMTGKMSDRYFDLKNGGVMRPWKDHS